MTHFLEPLLRRRSCPARLIDATTGAVIASDVAAIEMAAGSATAAGVRLGIRLAISAPPPQEVTAASGRSSGLDQTI